ncbi:hypothetical protein DFH11DRAFT_1189123 [Phellopilus nigrolimitatus]|nr:hypothetical protein DFH11DRAFT_1189123 [Phellopilus nigrolimitatus]
MISHSHTMIASAEMHTPPLPFEITEHIIQLHLGTPYKFPSFHFAPDLAPLLLVCKGWYLYGRRILYEYITISDDTPCGLLRLARTLQKNPRLARLVHSFAFESNIFSDWDVALLSQIISLSSNLTHISIGRAGIRWKKLQEPQGTDSLRRALAKRSLKNFRYYSTYRMDWDIDDMLLTPEELAGLMTSWPDLEDITFVPEETFYWQTEVRRLSFVPPTRGPGKCLALRRVELSVFDIPMCILAEIAPFIEEADIGKESSSVHQGDGDIDLHTCLSLWSETLLHLKLPNTSSLGELPSLRNLRTFYFGTGYMCPSFMKDMHSLEDLLYEGKLPEVEVLEGCFRSGTESGAFLPALKSLHLRTDKDVFHLKRASNTVREGDGEIAWSGHLEVA